MRTLEQIEKEGLEIKKRTTQEISDYFQSNIGLTLDELLSGKEVILKKHLYGTLEISEGRRKSDRVPVRIPAGQKVVVVACGTYSLDSNMRHLSINFLTPQVVYFDIFDGSENRYGNVISVEPKKFAEAAM